jgi:hypothetical protein
MVSLPTGPRGVLEQVTYVFAGLQYEPCVPPYFLISRRVSSEDGR